MAGFAWGDGGSAHHFPQQTGRKLGCRGSLATTVAHRTGSPADDAGELEDVGVRGGNVVMDERQEERNGLGDGSLVRGVAYAESWSGENASENVATVLDLVCYLGCTRI